MRNPNLNTDFVTPRCFFLALPCANEDNDFVTPSGFFLAL
jgi:hypothetical protein